MALVKTVLVAEDNIINQQLIKKMFSSLHCDVFVVANGQEVLDYYQQYCAQIAFILMDGDMPVLDGYKASQAIKRWEFETKRLGSVPIIAWTAHSGIGLNKESWSAVGVHDFLSKPVLINDLKTLLLKYFPKASVAQPKEEPQQKEIGLQTKNNIASFALNAEALEQLLMLDDNNPGLFQSLIVRYKTEGQRLLAEIERQLNAKQAEPVRKAAHTLKSSSASFGATDLAGICKDIEYNSEDFTAITGWLESAKGLFTQTLEALEKIQSSD